MLLRRTTFGIIIFVAGIRIFAETRALTSDDYARAEKFMGYNTNPLVLRAGVRPTWLPGDRFWYRVATEKGDEFILVDPVRGTRGALTVGRKNAVRKVVAVHGGALYTLYVACPAPVADVERNGATVVFQIELRER